jgi:hypothetical protein
MVPAPNTHWPRLGAGTSRWLGAWLLCSIVACNLDREPTDLASASVPMPNDSPAPAIGEDAGPSRQPRGAEPAPPEPTRDNGETCTVDGQCTSGHCDSGLCCDAGRCCANADQCRQSSAMDATCDEPAACQGTRGEVICQDFQCTTRNGVADDRACDATIEADDCGAYSTVFCDGRSDQRAPRCPTSCISDQDCDPEAHCDETCQPDVVNGEACEEDSDCAGGHCSAGTCCSSGDCCRMARDCRGYDTPPTCVDPQSCQGMRTDATCTDFVCGSTMTDDDSACGRGMPAQTCGLYRDVACNGTVAQTVGCDSTCASDLQCDPDAHCEGRYCSTDKRDGANCQEPSDCESGHCGGGFCCRGGDCCMQTSDCPSNASCDTRTFTCEEDSPPPPSAGSGGGSGSSG